MKKITYLLTITSAMLSCCCIWGMNDNKNFTVLHTTLDYTKANLNLVNAANGRFTANWIDLHSHKQTYPNQPNNKRYALLKNVYDSINENTIQKINLIPKNNDTLTPILFLNPTSNDFEHIRANRDKFSSDLYPIIVSSDFHNHAELYLQLSIAEKKHFSIITYEKTSDFGICGQYQYYTYTDNDPRNKKSGYSTDDGNLKDGNDGLKDAVDYVMENEPFCKQYAERCKKYILIKKIAGFGSIIVFLGILHQTGLLEKVLKQINSAYNLFFVTQLP